jgi:hypothetical protein
MPRSWSTAAIRWWASQIFSLGTRPGAGAGSLPRHLQNGRIREDAEWLVRAISPCALAWLVTVLVPDMPLLARGYIAEYLWQLAEGPLHAERDVEVAATALGTGRGVLERRLKNTILPRPKEPANWLTLLLVTHAARRLASAPGHVAAELGLNRHRWGRLHASSRTPYPSRL